MAIKPQTANSNQVPFRLFGIDIATHRMVLGVLFFALLYTIATTMRWAWLEQWWPQILQGIGVALAMLFGSVILGFMLAVPLGLMQVSKKWYLLYPARGFCTLIRGTPLLLQLWLLYYGLGSLFPSFPWIQESWIFPLLREGWIYGLVALTVSFGAYEGEVMRGAFASVAGGQLQAARAIGMTPFQILRRIWFPRAFYQALPTLVGETVLQLKSTPLVASVTVIDIYAVMNSVRQETLMIYEPLLLLAAVYLTLTAILVVAMRWVENTAPGRVKAKH